MYILHRLVDDPVGNAGQVLHVHSVPAGISLHPGDLQYVTQGYRSQCMLRTQQIWICARSLCISAGEWLHLMGVLVFN